MDGSATRGTDLRTGTPVWLSSGPPRLATMCPARLPRSIDVLVVGTGITGALVADVALSAGFSVLLLDRRRPCMGSTPASTALLQFEIDTPLTILSQQIGARNAGRAWLRSARAVDDLARRVSELAIPCSFRRRSAIYLPGSILDPAGLEREASARQTLGLKSTFIDERALRERTGIEHAAALLSEGAAEADPLRLAAGLLRRAIARGAMLAAPLEVGRVNPHSRGVDVEIVDGPAIRARYLVFATGYEIPYGVPANGHSIISTWCLATRPQPERLWPCRDLIWEAADPYLYIRTTADGRLVAGGEDEDISDPEQRDRLTEAKIAKIRGKLARLFPALDLEPEFVWAGCFGQSETGLPSIGAVPRMQGCYAVLDYGGNGITFSVVAAQIVGQALRGKDDPDADLFAFRD